LPIEFAAIAPDRFLLALLQWRHWSASRKATLQRRVQRFNALPSLFSLLAEKLLHAVQPALGFGVVASGIALADFFEFAQ